MRNTGGNIGKIITIALMAGCIFLTSCGGVQDVKQEFIPDTVSESAIREETDNEKAAETSVKYKYRNSTNLYMEDDWSIEQRDLDGVLQKTFTLESKGFEYLREVYTDDNWLYYIREKKNQKYQQKNFGERRL